MERVREWDVEALAESSRRNQRWKANWATVRKSGTFYGAVELAVEGEGALRVTTRELFVPVSGAEWSGSVRS